MKATIAGLDTNILCYSLDPAFPEHRKSAKLLSNLSPEFSISLNPTVFHETYHTLVYGQKWTREEARMRLGMMLRHPYVRFCNQTKSTSSLALRLAGKYNLGGRDSLILANFLANEVPALYTHDGDLLRLKIVEWRRRRMRILDPVDEA